ncbi:MAG: efflux RND transporter permease subunit, partial [Nitrospira sp.]
MAGLKTSFVLALLAIFALLAVHFRSYSQPLIIMSVIPFGLVGAVIGHVAMGLDLSMVSGFGLVALTGIVVNDSLLMVDVIKRHKDEASSLTEIVILAGTKRFRPIILTTLTTFLGLMPIIFEQSVQAQFLMPMALTLGVGVVFATAITLVL